jgi:hypothetical protein
MGALILGRDQGVCPASVINCNTRHAGQIEYLRGLVNTAAGFRARKSEAAVNAKLTREH